MDGRICERLAHRALGRKHQLRLRCDHDPSSILESPLLETQGDVGNLALLVIRVVTQVESRACHLWCRLLDLLHSASLGLQRHLLLVLRGVDGPCLVGALILRARSRGVS